MLVRILKRAAGSFHRLLLAGPPLVFRVYIGALGSLSRRLPTAVGIRIKNSLVSSSTTWPDIKLKPRPVTLGQNTRILLYPHLGEFDGEALFVKRLPYEPNEFRWLELHASDRYDIVIEIGANIGVYSVFFDQLSKRPNSRLKKIVSFEPSQEAYRRLIANLTVNGARNVTAFAAAVGTKSGIQSFYEPKGHLANGTFNRHFAQIISSDIATVPVMVLDAKDLEFFFESNKKVLLKIDAEGYEAEILAALVSIIRNYKPDIIVEVLPQTQEDIETSEAIVGYRRYLLAENGPIPRQRIEASLACRDWLLQPVNHDP
jgi:FkbM family methyltransferase